MSVCPQHLTKWRSQVPTTTTTYLASHTYQSAVSLCLVHFLAVGDINRHRRQQAVHFAGTNLGTKQAAAEEEHQKEEQEKERRVERLH